jgi:hypothetical protein
MAHAHAVVREWRARAMPMPMLPMHPSSPPAATAVLFRSDGRNLNARVMRATARVAGDGSQRSSVRMSAARDNASARRIARRLEA